MQKPKSANPIQSLIFGLVCFLAFIFWQRHWAIQTEFKALIAIILTTVALGFVDLVFFKIHHRESTGLKWGSFNPQFSRVFTKWMGLIGTLLTIGFLYRIFPEYQGEFYDSYFIAVYALVIPFSVLSFMYFYVIDGYMLEPEDTYYNVGLVYLLQFEKVKTKDLKQYSLGWLVKAFFMPLMFTYFVSDIEKFNSVDFATLTKFKDYYDLLYNLIFIIDVGFVSMGYAISLKLLDSHLRSVESTMLGWVSALACYQPFWSLLNRQYLKYDEAEKAWGYWFVDSPNAYVAWGVCILLLFGIYVWSSVMFGYRFSNLTNRGIITDGPYRWIKHPAYVSKCAAYWMISMPFLSQFGIFDAIKKCALLLLLNFIYYIRAITEERHLSADPEYRTYVLWIKQNGLVAKVAKAIGRIT